jgi:hypothetical protein
MSDNFGKVWLQSSQNKLATKRAAEAIQSTGRALPCRVTAVNGSFVTVAFEVQAAGVTLPSVTIPKNESQWLRAPTQVGDYGVTEPADANLSAVSGLTRGIAQLTQGNGNLTALMFTPIGSAAFGASPDPNKAWINGPAGAVLSDTAQTVVVTANKETGQVTITAPTSVVIKAGGKTFTFSAAGATMSNGVVFETHIHTQGADSHGDTEENTSGPVAP